MEAQKLGDLVRAARAAVGLVHNRQADAEQWVPEADEEHMVNTVTGERREWRGAEQQAEEEAEMKRRQQRLAQHEACTLEHGKGMCGFAISAVRTQRRSSSAQ